jgi:uncharacterized repeat protein (TIGR01451 family)
LRRLLKHSVLVAAVVAAPVAAALAVDLAITKTDNRTQVWPGQPLTYIITVTNGGPDTATGALVTDTLPGGLENAAWSSSTTGAATTATGAGIGNLLDTVTIPAGDMIIYTLTAFVAGDAAGTLSNTATVAAPSGVIDTNPANNAATDENIVQEEPVANVRPVYANVSPTPNAFAAEGAAANGAAAFGGHAGDRSAPVTARYLLRTSSFGQPLARFRASPTHTEDTIEDARRQLFYMAGAPSEQNNAAAFRYITTFFNLGNTGALDGIQMRLDNSLPYDARINPNDASESDEERALRVARDVIEALRFEPYNKDLRQLLLDIYYYRTLGRQIAAKDQVVRAYQLNFSTELSEQEPFGGAINKEIAAFTTAAQALTGVLDPYRELLLDPLGVRISEFDAGYGGGLPFGYYLFQQEVPYRSVYAATFVDYDADTGLLSGDPAPVDLGDTAAYSVLYVTPTAFHVDASGAAIAFTISNVGTAALQWEAMAENPAGSDMLTFQTSGTTPLLNVSGSVAAGSTSNATVRVASNPTPLMRVGKVRVQDTGSGRHLGLVYEVTIVQAANTKPIIETSVNAIVQRTYHPLLFEEHEVVVRNAGMGTLAWTASVVVPPGSQHVGWLTIKGPNEAAYGSTATGTDYGRIVARVYTGLHRADPLQIRIAGSDPATAPVVLDVYYANNPPPAAATSAKAVDLLTLYPEKIPVSRQGGVRNFAVLDGRALSWTAAVTQGGAWLRITSVSSDSGLVELAIAANGSRDSREGMVTVTAAGASPPTRTVVVRQDGTSETALCVSPATRTVPATSGISTPGATGTGFLVARAGTGNLTWTARVVEGQDWLSIASGQSGRNAGGIRFSYDQNPRTEGRTGTILVTSPEAMAGHDRIEVQVMQQGSSGAAVLTAGFKDLALIFDVMRDEAQVKKELAKRYALRNLAGDLQAANQLISETITRHTAALNDIGGIIPGWRSLMDPNSNLLAKYFGWQQAVAELNTTRDFINGDANILGFQTNFLFLVQNFPGQSPDLFDSFDKLLEYLYAGQNDTQTLSSPLGFAQSKYLTARAEYDTYLNTQDEIREELRTQNLEHRKWMFDAIGVDPGNDVDHPADAARYRNPGGNYGSRIWQQERSIERAGEGLRQNAARLQNIYNQINTELWRRGQETQINARIGDVYITFGNKLAAIEEQIGAINAAQAFANQMVELTNAEAHIFSLGASVAARLANAVAQAAAETGKGFLEGDKHQLAAQENQAIRQLEDQILGVNSRALIANLYGEASVVGVASAELALAIAQEAGARQALLDEWHYRESLMRENNQALLGRAFADPVHRLRMRRAMIEAEASFAVAQRWVFFTIRALEYKWNTPFIHSNAAGTWSMDSVFRSRTAKDLIDLMAAVKDFDGLMQGSARSDDRFDWFSFKKDFMGLTPVYDSDGETELRIYAHPLTGHPATATQVFQARVAESFDPSTGVVTLPFSTFKDNGETFFRGPRRDPTNPAVVLSRGQYLDKIIWMKVNLLGEFDTSEHQRVMGALTYSGGSFLRNARVGRILDPARPDQISGEFTRWPTKFWFYDSGLPQADPPVVASWRASDEQTTEIALNLTTQPREEMPDSVARIDVFQERSVACDRWILKIFAAEGGIPRVNIDAIEDIEILFYHVSKDRPALKKGEEDQP